MFPRFKLTMSVLHVQQGTTLSIMHAAQLYYVLLFFGFSISRYLDNQDVQLLKPICKALGIPIDPPVEVIVKKSALKEDPQTGRQIEYKGLMAPTPSSSCSAFVSLNSVPEFGQIQSFFVYRSTQFVIIKKFHHPTICSYGLIVIPDRTSQPEKS